MDRGGPIRFLQRGIRRGVTKGVALESEDICKEEENAKDRGLRARDRDMSRQYGRNSVSTNNNNNTHNIYYITLIRTNIRKDLI